MRAALYLRISLDKTGEEAGVNRQREDCLALVDREGWELHDTYVDNDRSAYKNRPEFNRMLDDIKHGQIDTIVAWQPDRLYRRFADLETIVETIEKHDVQVHTVKIGDLNLGSAYGRMIARMLSVIAMGEGELKSERWRRSVQQRREQGLNPGSGSRLFGYTRDLDIIPDEADTARQMATDIIDGIPILTVARRLEEEGVLTTRGTTWRPGTIRQYLHNPRLAGYSTLRGQIVSEGQWEPILDRDTWETVRAMLTARARPFVPRKSLLNGLLHCGKCGHRMITSGAGGKRTYRCPNRPGMPGCGGVSGNAEPIEEIVETYAQTRLADPRVRQRIAQLSATAAPEVLAEITSLEQRILELENSLDQPGIPVATIVRAIDRSRDRLADLQGKLVTARPIALPVQGGEWPTDLERRRRLVDTVVANVELLPATKRIKSFDVERVRVTDR